MEQITVGFAEGLDEIRQEADVGKHMQALADALEFGVNLFTGLEQKIWIDHWTLKERKKKPKPVHPTKEMWQDEQPTKDSKKQKKEKKKKKEK